MTAVNNMETKDDLVRKNIIEICESSSLNPNESLRIYMENIILNIVNGYLESNNQDTNVSSLNEFFECDDFVELTWYELYYKLFRKGMIEELNTKYGSQSSTQNEVTHKKEKVIHFANEMN